MINWIARDYSPIYSADRKRWCIFTRKPDSLWLTFFAQADSQSDAIEDCDMLNAGLPA